MTSRPVLMAMAGATCIAFSAILVRLADVPPSTAAFYRCAYALPALGLLAWWERRRFGPLGRRVVALGLVAGVLFMADLILWHHAIAAVGAGLATVLGNVQVVIVPLAAWLLLRERPAGRTLASVPVVLVGIVLISGVVGAGAYGSNPPLGVLFGILTAIAYAGFLLVLRAGSADLRRPAGPLFYATASSAVVTLPVGAGLGELELEPSWPVHGWLVLLALTSQVAGWLLIAAALPRLPAAITSVTLTLQPALAVVFAVILLDEDPSPTQIAGVAVIVAGIVLATAGRRRRAYTEP
ncbi:MAG TPA: DMT family transporter [Gaiellaceae bacterium]|nr:DMT family transporter [Gaiellaceae bacterium]